MKKDFLIETERLVLKPMSMEYLDSVHEYAIDPENTTYMMYLPNDTLEDTIGFLKYCEDMWNDETTDTFEAAILFEGKQIGSIGITVNDGVAEFGWILNKKYWGRGFTTEVAKVILSYAVNTLNIHTFIATCDQENAASASVMKKLGMSLVRTSPGRKNKLTPEGKTCIECLYRMEI